MITILSRKPGPENQLADALSHLPARVDDTVTATEYRIQNIVEKVEDNYAITTKKLKEKTATDPILTKVLFYIQQGWPEKSKIPVHLLPFYEKRNEISYERKLLLWNHRIIIPTSLHNDILNELHLAHFGITTMRHQASATVWWPKINEDIEKFVKLCKPCQRFQNKMPENPLIPWNVPDEPWERLHLDFTGPFKGKQWLIIIDAYSRWLEVIPVPSANSDYVIKCLRKLFATFGVCKQAVTDNGSPFTSSTLKKFLEANRVHHIAVTPYHSRSNGMAERPIQTFKKHFLRAAETYLEESQRLALFLFAYRRRIHIATGKSPFELMFGHPMRSVLNTLACPDRDTQKNYSLKGKLNFDGKKMARSFNNLDPVWVISPNGTEWSPGTIEKKKGPLSYDVKVEEKGQSQRKHVDHLRRRCSSRERKAPTRLNL